MKSYRRSDNREFTLKFMTKDHPSMWRYDCIATSVEDAISKLKASTAREISFLRSISIDGKKLADAVVDQVAKQYFGDTIVDVNMSECDGGGAVGGDAGGAASAGDAGSGAATGGDSGIATDAAGTTTTEVLGKNEPGGGFFGKDNFYIPSKTQVPFHRWEIGNGGSVRRKLKNGKRKKYAYEKGMKVVVDMLEDEDNI